jgi:hypothetical protein
VGVKLAVESTEGERWGRRDGSSETRLGVAGDWLVVATLGEDAEGRAKWRDEPISPESFASDRRSS